MVRALAALILVATLPALAAPAYRVEPATVALGEPVTLTLTSRPGTLDKLDLAPVAADFEIRSRTLGGDGKEESLVLTLYPLRTGRIALPALGQRGRPPVVTVTEQSDTVPRVRFRFETDPGQYHVRQFVRFTLEACDDGSLMWQRPQLATREGLFLRTLNEEQIDVEREGERCTAHRWHWSLLPTAAGPTELPLPMFEANKFGQRLRYPPPVVSFEGMPVPGWLPAEAAIGRPQLTAQPLPSQWPIERPLAWRMEVVGGYSTEALRNLLQVQFANQALFAGYPPEVEELASDGAEARHAITLFASSGESGEARLPDLVLPWYEPETGRLQQLRLPGAQLQFFDPIRQQLFYWGSWLAAVLAASGIGYGLWSLLGWRYRRFRRLAVLRRANDAESLMRQLCGFSLRPHATQSATLREWQRRMEAECETAGLEELVDTLEQMRYGKGEGEFAGMRENILRCLSRARPNRRAREKQNRYRSFLD